MEDIEVSIITVCLNEIERISGTIESIVRQNYPSKELIVVDGGSSDGTLKYLEENRGSFSHLVSEKDSGVYHAMNKGVQLAKGNYVLFMNGGDRFYSDNVLSELLNLGQGEDILYGDFSSVYPDGSTTITRYPSKVGYMFLTFNCICHQAIMCRRSLFDRVGYFDTGYQIASDYSFLVQSVLVHNYSTRHIPLIVSWFYRDGLSDLATSKQRLRLERLRIQQDFLPRRYYYLSKAYYWVVDMGRKFLPARIRGLGNRFYAKYLRAKEI
jgi:glycosyltransferase involved in cell wall biosynthesis